MAKKEVITYMKYHRFVKRGSIGIAVYHLRLFLEGRTFENDKEAWESFVKYIRNSEDIRHKQLALKGVLTTMDERNANYRVKVYDGKRGGWKLLPAIKKEEK